MSKEMDDVTKIKAYFRSHMGVHLSRRKLALQLGVRKGSMRHTLWLLKTIGVIRQSKPSEVGSKRQTVAAYVTL